VNAGDILYARLVAAATTAGTRIYPVEVPLEADLPALAYEVTLDDGVDGTAPLQRVTIRIDAVAHTDDAAQTLAQAADAALDSYSARDGDTYLRPLQRNGWSEIRDSEYNAWVRQISYRAWISY
jgi:hypothetical protein